MPTQFAEIRLPVSISEGSKGGPGFSTDVFESETGFEQRNSKWAKARAMYNITYGIKQKADMDAVLEFFYNVHGRAIGFRFKDWTDYNVTDQIIGATSGAPVTRQIIKTYVTGSETYTRTIQKIVATPAPVVHLNAALLVESADYTINYNTGVLSYLGAGTGNLHVTCEFDVPVRFDIDQLNIVAETWLQESVTDNIILVEIKPTS